SGRERPTSRRFGWSTEQPLRADRLHPVTDVRAELRDEERAEDRQAKWRPGGFGRWRRRRESACAGVIAVTRTPYHAACLVSFPRKFSCAIPRGGPRSDQGVWMLRRMLVVLFVLLLGCSAAAVAEEAKPGGHPPAALFVFDASGSMLRKVEGKSKDEIARSVMTGV